MKKIFSFLAAMLVVFAANAKVWNVGPGHNEESDRTDCNLYVTLDRLAQAGDTILLADGEYIETLSMYVKGAAVIMAAEGANPVLKQSSYFKLKADAKFIGIKFEHVAESNGYCMYFQPGCSRLELQDCEITGFKETCIMSWDEYACNNLIINNCYIHDNVKCVIYDPSGYIANTVITNSTIVNNDCSPWSAAPIDIRKGSSTDHTLLVDHCTFYNNKVSSDSYADIRPRGLNGVKVKNCIFAHPEAYAARATRFVNDDTVEGCEVINCLTFNYTKNTDRFGHYTGSTLTGCAAGNPLFVNAAEGNFNLGEGSPALTMNDGAPIGDPRWVPSVAPVEPQMKTIYCKMDKDWWKADGAAVGVYTWDDGGNAKAAWPGERMTPVEGETDIWSIELDINTYHMCIFTRVNGEGDVADWGAKTSDLLIPTDENDMFTITNDDPSWGDPGCVGVWSKYEKAAPAVEREVTKVGINFPTANCPADNNIEMAGTFAEGTMWMEKIIATGWFVSYEFVNAAEDDTFKFRDKTNNNMVLCQYIPANAVAEGKWVQAIFTFGNYWSDDTWKGTPCKLIEFDLSDGSVYAWKEGMPEPDPDTAVEDVAAGTKAVKVIRDGQLLIEKNGKTYNVMGAEVR